jgi:uncharacterized Zn finger protein (UPF0148 family)
MRITLLRRCFECGQPLGKKDVFCPRCGAKQPREPKRQDGQKTQLQPQMNTDEHR